MEQNADDGLVVAAQARIDSLAGRAARARDRTQRAVGIAVQSGSGESAASILGTQATWEALLEERARAQATVAAMMKRSHSMETTARAARVLAIAGQPAEAKRMMDRLVQEHPSDTLLLGVDAPLVEASLAMSLGKADQAVRTLEAVRPYELGYYAGLIPKYLRGEACLQLKRGEEAAAEFRSVIDHRGLEPTSPIWIVAQLGLARAYALQHDAPHARAAYEDFLTRWKDADADIPILRQARTERTRLH
jgi:hypothetical protein